MPRNSLLRIVVVVICVKAYFLAVPLTATVKEWFAAKPAAIRYSELIDPYWVNGGTDGQIIRSLRRQGGKRTGIPDTFGSISPVRSFRYTTNFDPIGCAVAATKFELSITLYVPQWRNYPFAHKLTQQKWDTFAKHVLQQQRGAASKVRMTMEQINSRVTALPRYTDCKGLDSAVQAIIRSELASEASWLGQYRAGKGRSCYPYGNCRTDKQKQYSRKRRDRIKTTHRML